MAPALDRMMPHWTLPRWAQSIKFRLAVTYAATVYAVGSLLIGIMYAWQVHQLSEPQLVPEQRLIQDAQTGQVFELTVLTRDAVQAHALEVFEQNVNLQVAENMKQASLVGLLILVVVAFIIGWILATITLRPINRMTAVARDISGSDLSRRISLPGPDDELKRLADTFDAMLDRLQTAFEDQRRFVQDASHELRNPLAVARTNLELVLSDPDADPDQLRRSIEVAHRSTGRMSELVDDLVVQARSGVPQIELVEVDLRAVADEVRTQFLDPARERSIDIVLHDDGPAPVKGDELALNRVITNLVSNALRFAPSHSEVTIDIAHCDRMVELKVIDRGPGLSEEDQPHVFTRFWRGRKAGTGSGLGLSIVKQVVERHGGSVAVESRLGHGATFVVRLPGTPLAAAPVADAAVVGAGPDSNVHHKVGQARVEERRGESGEF